AANAFSQAETDAILVADKTGGAQFFLEDFVIYRYARSSCLRLNPSPLPVTIERNDAKKLPLHWIKPPLCGVVNRANGISSGDSRHVSRLRLALHARDHGGGQLALELGRKARPPERVRGQSHLPEIDPDRNRFGRLRQMKEHQNVPSAFQQNGADSLNFSIR